MKMRYLAVALLTVVGFFAWNLTFPSYSYHVRVTLHAEVNGQERSGSTVIAVRWQAQPQIGDASASRLIVQGQAALADLEPHGVLLLTLRDAGYFVPHAIAPGRPCVFGMSERDLRAVLGLQGTMLADRSCPPFVVWLPDRDRPESERGVPTNELPVTIAPGIRLTKVTFAMTHEPVTTDLAAKLPWLTSYADENYKTRTGQPYRLPAIWLTQGM